MLIGDYVYTKPFFFGILAQTFVIYPRCRFSVGCKYKHGEIGREWSKEILVR